MKPKISIIMPVYNSEKYLKDSIESIINQTFRDFEFIIINDGSTDNSLKIIKEYTKLDERIKIIDQKNTGIIGALNNGLKISNGDYIARMDSDDISLQNRLEKQVAFMEENRVKISGTWANIIDENGFYKKEKFNYPPKTWEKIKLYLIRGNPFIHPSVMFQKEIYEKEKDKNGDLYHNYKHIEDYELWTRLVPKYKSKNIQEYLLNYRVHSDQITKKFNLKMKLIGIKIRFLSFLRILKN
jgi:glycosyltransferase involved in cell wall biosynthesis